MKGNTRPTFALLVLFVISGFAGLIYQSIWSQYLGLTLGHAAYAQTLVLAIFMGGMAVGAWLASRYSLRWRRLILGYAVVEGVIGVCGLVFHPLFVAYSGLSQAAILPALDSAALASGYQWLSATAIIAPQSILLGATFPLMSAGLIRALPGEQGEVLGGLYFTNSLGAALGALAATFLLLPLVGLPGSMLTAGLLNILVAVGAWLVSRRLEPDPVAAEPSGAESREAPAQSQTPELRRLGRVLLWATAVSGAASFIYEVGWVRLLNQAFGTTIHSFELMLAAFIFGLAFGGLWVRKRAQRIVDAVRYVGYVQIWMAIAALLSIPVFTQSFHWVGWILSALSRSDGGYTLYEFATAAVALVVMFPAAFLAGMTLPLFTLALLRSGADERAIGRVYAANTLGSIAGVALMMHLLIPTMGVRLAVTSGALLDGLVGLYLLRVVDPGRLTRMVGAAALLLVTALGTSVQLGRPDPVQQTSGVFRTGVVDREGVVVNYLRDGKTATISVLTQGGQRVISTNGKPDAGLTRLGDPPAGDEITMLMLGMLPLAFHPAPDEVAVIGFGSGLSTHTLLGSEKPKRVDTIEIERAMVEGARLLHDRVGRAYDDPRSNIQIEDARTYFATGGRKYDVIVSEPSNPWVSGVASLFTREFYAFLKRHLKDQGLLVQWLHLYEIDDALVGTMLAALEAEFPQADLFLANDGDLIVVARQWHGPLVLQPIAAAGSELEAELRRVGIDRAEQLQLRHIGGIEVLRTYLRLSKARPHSDYYPTVSLNAPRTRFRGDRATLLPLIASSGLPVLDILDCRRGIPGRLDLPQDRYSSLVSGRHRALDLAAGLESGTGPGASRDLVSALGALPELSRRVAQSPALIGAWADAASRVATGTLGHLAPEDLSFWTEPQWLPGDAQAMPAVDALLEVYRATAMRSPVRMQQAAARALALDEEDDVYSLQLNEQLLLIGMLGAIGSGEAEAVAAFERRWAPRSGATMDGVALRSFLLAWADIGHRVCELPQSRIDWTAARSTADAQRTQ